MPNEPGAMLGVLNAAGGQRMAPRMAVARMLGGGGRGALDGGIGVSRELGRGGGSEAFDLARSAARARVGRGGGVPKGRDGSTLVPPFGRGGSETGRGACATGRGVTVAG